MSSTYQQAIKDIVYGLSGQSPWQGLRLLKNYHHALEAETGIALAGAAKTRYETHVGWALDELSDNSTGAARTSMIEARDTQIQALNAIRDTASALRSIANFHDCGLVAWTGLNVVYKAVHAQHGGIIAKIARSRPTDQGALRHITVPPSGQSRQPTPSQVLDAGVAPWRRINRHGDLCPTVLEDGYVGNHRYVLLEALQGRSLHDILTAQDPFDSIHLAQLATELLDLRQGLSLIPI